MGNRSLHIRTINSVETQGFNEQRAVFCYIDCTGPTEQTMSIRLPRDQAEKLYAMLGQQLNNPRKRESD